MTTSPGQEPRSGAPRGTARPRREGDPGWSGDSGGPRFTPSSGPGGGRSPRDSERPGRSSGSRGYGARSYDDRQRDRRGPSGPAARDRDRDDSRGPGRRPFDRGGRPVGGQAPGSDLPNAAAALRWIGTFTVRRALLVFFGAAVVGAIATIAAGRGPGTVLGILIVIGAGAATLGIRRQYAYLLIPMPAVTYLILAIVTGGIHDASLETSTSAIALSFLQWIGSGFFSIFAATLLVLLIFGGRLVASRRLVSGSLAVSRERAGTARPSRAMMTGRPGPARRESRAPWDDPDPWYDRDSGDGNPRGGRDDRDQRDGRDVRRDPRGRPPRPLPPGRSGPSARDERPRGDGAPRTSRPRGPRPGPNSDWDDRGSRNRR